MIDKSEIEELKLVFVTRQECSDINAEVDRRLEKDLVRLAVIEQQQKVNNWMTTGIVGGIIALLIKVFLGG